MACRIKLVKFGKLQKKKFFFHLLVSWIYDHDNPRSSFTLTICLHYEAFFRFSKFLTIFRFQYFFLGCISKGCRCPAKIMIFLKFSVFHCFPWVEFLVFWVFSHLKTWKKCFFKLLYSRIFWWENSKIVFFTHPKMRKHYYQ